MKVIATTNAPGAIGPYSQGFVVNGFVFTSGQIPVDPSTGNIPEGIAAQAEQDAEGMQGMRTLARNMTFLMKSIALGKEAYGLPEKERGIFTNFIR